MPASPPLETIALIEAADACEDAVIYLASTAMFKSRRLGQPTRDPIAAIYDDRIKRQARRLLLKAAMHLYGLNALFERQMLGAMSSYDLAGADDDALVEILDGLEDAAREEARECRERMGAGA